MEHPATVSGVPDTPGSSCVNQVMTPASPPEAHDGIRNLTALVPCRQVLGLQDGPTIVAGHSYGGQIMTALGTDAPNVAGLVYIAAFGLDQGESLGALLSQGPVTPALAHLSTDQQGFGRLPEEATTQCALSASGDIQRR